MSRRLSLLSVPTNGEKEEGACTGDLSTTMSRLCIGLPVVFQVGVWSHKVATINSLISLLSVKINCQGNLETSLSTASDETPMLADFLTNLPLQTLN